MNASREENSRKMRIITILIALILFIAALAVFFSITFGWLGRLRDVDSNAGMMIEDSDGAFDLFSEGSDAGFYDTILANLQVATEGTAATVANKSGTSTAGKTAVYWNMTYDSNMNNSKKDENNQNTTRSDCRIMPGSSGKLTFYIVSNVDGQLNITLNLNLEGLKESGTASNRTYTPVPDAVNALLSGHICFFKTCTNGVYSDYITNSTYTFSRNNVSDGDSFECSLYWYWPEVIDDILIGNAKFDSTSQSAIIAKMVADVTAVCAATSESPYDSLFFRFTNTEILEEAVTQSNLTNFSSSIDEYGIINSFYNQADQRIGMNTDYVLLKLESSPEVSS